MSRAFLRGKERRDSPSDLLRIDVQRTRRQSISFAEMPHLAAVGEEFVHDPRWEVGSDVDNHSEESGWEEEAGGDGSYEAIERREGGRGGE